MFQFSGFIAIVCQFDLALWSGWWEHYGKEAPVNERQRAFRCLMEGPGSSGGPLQEEERGNFISTLDVALFHHEE